MKGNQMDVQDDDDVLQLLQLRVLADVAVDPLPS